MQTAEIIGAARHNHRTYLTEVEAKEVLRSAGINTVDTRLARTREEAIATSQELGFPVVLKIVSPDIIHKSDVGGVKLNLADADSVGRAYEEIVATVREKQPSSTIEGVSVQQMARLGTEVIIGMSKDPQFGPVLMFGLGGVLVEILKDVSFRIVPLTRRDAREMIHEIKGYPLLEGYRGQEAADIGALEDMLLKLSEFADSHPDVKEVDLNPIFAYRDGALAVDARIILEEGAET